MRTVLIIDDDATLRALLQQKLGQWGYRTLLASDGEEGWDAYLRHRDARIAIVDWLMPKLDGLSLIRRIREHEQREERGATYVIILTSQSSQAQVAQGFEAGADDYLIKGDFQAELQRRLKVAEKQLEFEEMVARDRQGSQ